MPIENPNVGGPASEWLWAGALAFLGRVLVLANLPVRPSGWALVVNLLWEIPVAGALTAVGLAAAQSAGLQGNQALGLVVVIAYGGPRSISFFLARWLAARPPAP